MLISINKLYVHIIQKYVVSVQIFTKDFIKHSLLQKICASLHKIPEDIFWYRIHNIISSP